MSLDRLPPHSPEAEQGVLGCILLSPNDCLSQCVDLLPAGPEAFYDLRHQTIYRVLLDMYDRQQAIDLITLQQALKDLGRLEGVGGVAYLGTLPDAVPSSANLSYYAAIVQEKYLLRKVVQTCTDIVGRVYDCEGEVNALLDDVERDIMAIRGAAVSAPALEPKALVGEAMKDIEKAWQAAGRLTGLSTGLIDLDRLTGGLHPGEMTVIAAYPSCGKTSLALNIAERILLEDHMAVGINSLEMTAVSLVTRCICSHARVNLRNIGQGFIAERDFDRITGAAGAISSAAIRIDDTAGLSIYRLRAKARRLVQQHNIKLWVVDYLQLLNASGGARRVESRQQEVADISAGIKGLAKELNIPVLALSQLNDDGKLRESRAIGQDADNLWLLVPATGATETGPECALPVKLNVAKQRNGPTGIIDLVFLKAYTRFVSAAKIDPGDQPDLPRATAPDP